MTSKASFLAILSALCLAACSEFRVEHVDANRSLVLFEEEPAGENCAEGGQKVISGVDFNLNGTLEEEEVAGITYVCTGAAGQSELINVVEVAAGEVCQFGGQTIQSGFDRDADGVLSENEVTNSQTICSGTQPQSGGSILKVATFLNQSCALVSNQSVQCWGRAADGSDASPAPLTVSGIHKASDLAAGCALSEDGLVRCWEGLDGSPRAVPNLIGAKAIAGAATHHMCALMEGGAVRCWGRNDAGQLGSGNYLDTSEPVAVIESDGTELKGAISVKVGLYHTCATIEDGTARCWGWNGLGQLGAVESEFSSRAAKVKLDEAGSDLGGVQELALGYGHTCALLNDKSVKCWGSNEVGQLGQPSELVGTGYPQVVPLETGFGAIAIDAGYGHTCAANESGKVHCWGWNVYGQVGSATAGRFSATPVEIAGLSDVKALSLGEAHTGALQKNGVAKCWGNNSLGQFGNGVEAVNRGYQLTPSTVVELDTVQSVASGYLFSCALLDDSTAKCWGNNEFNQLGNDAATSTQRFPSLIETNSGAPFASISQLALGYSHACVLSQVGTVHCWGDNEMGQLGNGSTVASASPKQINALSTGVRSIAAGHAHNCAINSGGSVLCWGYNAFGQLGTGTNANKTTPNSAISQEFLPTNSVSSLALGRAHSCALLTDKTVKCWGNNDYGQLGDAQAEASLTPVAVNGIANVQQLVSGHAHLCALLLDGSVTCWGSNLLGESGVAIDASAPIVAPTQVELSGKATALASGYQHTCALLADKTVRCWGNNAFGQLGDGQLNDSGTPVAVSGLSGVRSISTGHSHTCASLDDGTVKCWGSDLYGQTGQVNGQPTPVDAIFLQ